MCPANIPNGFCQDSLLINCHLLAIHWPGSDCAFYRFEAPSCGQWAHYTQLTRVIFCHRFTMHVQGSHKHYMQPLSKSVISKLLSIYFSFNTSASWENVDFLAWSLTPDHSATFMTVFHLIWRFKQHSSNSSLSHFATSNLSVWRIRCFLTPIIYTFIRKQFVLITCSQASLGTFLSIWANLSSSSSGLHSPLCVDFKCVTFSVDHHCETN